MKIVQIIWLENLTRRNMTNGDYINKYRQNRCRNLNTSKDVVKRVHCCKYLGVNMTNKECIETN